MIVSQYSVKYPSGKIHIKYKCICDCCQQDFDMWQSSILKQRKRTQDFNKTFCRKCVYKKRRPGLQSIKNSGFWTDEKRKALGEKIKNSIAYQESRKHIDITGEKNGMFGKKHTKEARLKMSKSRAGRFGENAPAWKGGKTSVVSLVKGYIHKALHWYKHIFERDNYKCVLCGKKDKIDAHHLIPISHIIKEILSEHPELITKTQQIEFLCNHPKIQDTELKNGITLCRICHKHIHKNWGNHYSKVKTLEELKADYEINKETWIK